MAPPFCISLTGADDGVDLEDLLTLHADFPTVEFGILIYAGREGRPRYPTLAWIMRFLTEAPKLPKALHVCGDSLSHLLQGDPDVAALARRFGRVQLNVRTLTPHLAEQINAFATRYDGIVITQHHAAVEELWRDITAPRHQLLIDGSAGTGTLPAQWPAPIAGRVCGYAGGLKPENIAEQLPLIRAAAGEAPYWIDLESGLRNAADQFDVARARQFLCYVKC